MPLAEWPGCGSSSVRPISSLLDEWMRARHLITVIIPILALVPLGFGQWQRAETGSLAWLHALSIVDEKAAWVAGSNGTLLKTDDGGSSWRKVPFPTRDNIRDVYFRDRLEGWALCERQSDGYSPRIQSYLLKTSDGGATWSAVQIEVTSGRWTRFVNTRNSGSFLVGEGGSITAVPGTRQGQGPAGLPVRLLILGGADPGGDGITLVGAGGTVLFSKNGGAQWFEGRLPATKRSVRLNSVAFVNHSTGWAVGSGGALLKTTDGGRSWDAVEVPGTSEDLTDVGFRSKKDGFVVGAGGVVLRTTDGGVTWSPHRLGKNHRFERVGFAGDRVMIVGLGGTILTTDLRKL
jgi:photosystem II stability/assembly factor-like uncharacterized protein